MAKSNRLVLVDADSLIYLAGVAGQSTHYDAVMEDEGGTLTTGRFESAQSLKDHCAENQLAVIDRETVVTPLPLNYSLHIVKTKLKEIERRYGKRMRVYIKSAEGKNYRDEVYTVQKYKGNRNTPKPIHYDGIVDYMVGTWDAIRINLKEVDDQVALDAAESSIPYVVCSPDKDLDQIPGLHWNYRIDTEYEVSEEYARKFFWTQVLMGDNADNIAGCWKIGEGRAKVIIEEAWDEAWLTSEFEERLWDLIVSYYEASLEHPQCPYKDMDPVEVALQTARAVWMQNKRNVMWNPPGIPFEPYITEEEDDGW